MKPPVADHLKSQGITFSLKPDLYRQLLARVEQLDAHGRSAEIRAK